MSLSRNFSAPTYNINCLSQSLIPRDSHFDTATMGQINYATIIHRGRLMRTKSGNRKAFIAAFLPAVCRD